SGTADFSLIDYTLPLIFGTVLASALALAVAIPVSIGIALFISHYAPRRMAAGLGYLIDLLAAVPSVVYGLWGGIWLVPRLEPLYLFLNNTLGSWPVWPQFLPWVGGEPVIALFAGDPTAPMRNLASASVVLAVMVLPIITAVSREVFLQTPPLQEEAALALGATRWEVIRTVVLPFGRSGAVAASMLGLGRALGETMAVLMILAPGFTFSLHILEVGNHQSIAANIASRQAEASGVDMSLLVFTGLVLFVLTFIINSIARWIVSRCGVKSGGPMSTTTPSEQQTMMRPADERRLPWYHLIYTGIAGLVLATAILAVFDALSIASAILLGFVLHLTIGYLYSRFREGRRWAMDRLMPLIVIGAFAIAMCPRLSLRWEVISRGLVRVVQASPAPFAFWTTDMSGIIGGADAGGVLHATIGTLLITLWASIISIPIGLFTAIFLVEYADQGWRRVLGKGVTFLVHVMTGIPSIVAGLFGLALFIAFLPEGEQGVRMGIMGSVALSLLMIPTVVRYSEEMLRLVPMDLREASYALGV